jgi:hypothetical protein
MMNHAHLSTTPLSSSQRTISRIQFAASGHDAAHPISPTSVSQKT